MNIEMPSDSRRVLTFGSDNITHIVVGADIAFFVFSLPFSFPLAWFNATESDRKVKGN